MRVLNSQLIQRATHVGNKGSEIKVLLPTTNHLPFANDHKHQDRYVKQSCVNTPVTAIYSCQ